MEWLESHAGAVQALAALANLFVAGLLAGLTAWYVHLTRDIAKASQDQARVVMASASEARRQNAAALAALSLRLREKIAELQPDAPSHPQLFYFRQLMTSDVESLEAIARSVDPEAIVRVSRAAVPLRSMLSFIAHAQSISLSMGWSASERERKTWYEAHQDALAALDRVIDHCRTVAV